MHGIGEEGLQGPALAGWLLLQPSQETGKLVSLLALSENLRCKAV